MDTSELLHVSPRRVKIREREILTVCPSCGREWSLPYDESRDAPLTIAGLASLLLDHPYCLECLN